MKTIEIEDGEDDEDGCGQCLPCRYRDVVYSMEDALEMLGAGEPKQAKAMLTAAIADAKTSFEEWADDALDDEEDGDDLAATEPVGRA